MYRTRIPLGAERPGDRRTHHALAIVALWGDHDEGTQQEKERALFKAVRTWEKLTRPVRRGSSGSAALLSLYVALPVIGHLPFNCPLGQSQYRFDGVLSVYTGN